MGSQFLTFRIWAARVSSHLASEHGLGRHPPFKPRTAMATPCGRVAGASTAMAQRPRGLSYKVLGRRDNRQNIDCPG